MSLYRLDISYPDGRIVPMRDPIIGGDLIRRDRNDARAWAKVAAAAFATSQAHDTPDSIVCTRIYGAGAMRESFRVRVDR